MSFRPHQDYRVPSFEADFFTLWQLLKCFSFSYFRLPPRTDKYVVVLDEL